MISNTPKFTNSGRFLLLKALSGEKITFTRFKIGNGELSDSDNYTDLTDLVNPIIEFPITSIEAEDSGYVKITGTFDSSYITSDFRWRELGIFCKGTNGEETLYAYSNDGDNAGMLKANATDVQADQTIALIIAVGDAENVTAIIGESVLYTPKSDFESHVTDTDNPHGVTKAHVGLGNVPNVTTNNQTPTYPLPSILSELKSGERLGTAFGKIAAAVKALIAHIANKKNPHGVTASDVGAAKAEHSHHATDIIGGTLSAYRGGTGCTSLEMLADKLLPYMSTDYIIEQGEEEIDGCIWHYRKWKSGVSECFGTTPDKSYQLTVDWCGMYHSTINEENENSVPYPDGLFIEPPVVQARPSYAGYTTLLLPRGDGSAAASPNFYIAGANNEYWYTMHIYLTAVGRWKEREN